MKQLFTLILIVTIASAQSENSGGRCGLVAGSGCGKLVLNKTRRSDFLINTEAEERYADEGLTFSFRSDEVLDTIVATGKNFKTNLGIHPGDDEKQVQRVYGKPGIWFVIAKDKVWAIVIVPSDN